MNQPQFEEYLFDTIQDVLMRVISDLENMQYDLSILEAMKDERMSNSSGGRFLSYLDYKKESEEKKK